MAAETTPTEITREDFTGDALQRSFNLLRNEATGDYYFDLIEYPEGFDLNTIKFYRVEARSVAEVEAAFRRIVFGEGAATAETNANSVAGTVGEERDENENEDGAGNGGVPAGTGSAAASFASGVSGLRAVTGLRAVPSALGNLGEPTPRPPSRPPASGNNVGVLSGPPAASGTGARRIVIEENENNEDAATEARPAAASASAAAARPGMRTPINFDAVDGGRRRTRKLKR